MSVYAYNMRASKVLKPTYSLLILKGSFRELVLSESCGIGKSIIAFDVDSETILQI